MKHCLLRMVVWIVMRHCDWSKMGRSPTLSQSWSQPCCQWKLVCLTRRYNADYMMPSFYHMPPNHSPSSHLFLTSFIVPYWELSGDVRTGTWTIKRIAWAQCYDFIILIIFRKIKLIQCNQIVLAVKLAVRSLRWGYHVRSILKPALWDQIIKNNMYHYCI